MDTEHLHIYCRIAQLGSLSAVARERDVPVSQISRVLSRLESHYQVRLVHRSTHGLSLTPEGQTFLRHCQSVARSIDLLDAEFSRQTQQIRGTVRMAVSATMAQHVIAPGLIPLASQHPDLHIDLHVSDALVDMSREGIDLAIRVGEPQSDLLVARPLARFQRKLYASPSYLALHGTPTHPDDLSHHQLITSSLTPRLNDWAFKLGQHSEVRNMQGRWQANSSAMMFAMLLDGLGVGRAVELIARPYVEKGCLQPILEQWTEPQAAPIYAVMLSERHRLPKILVCFDYWADWFKQLDQSSPHPAR